MLQETIDAYLALSLSEQAFLVFLAGPVPFYAILLPGATKKAWLKWKAAWQRLKAKAAGAYHGWRNGRSV